jgi:hypothetical protein
MPLNQLNPFFDVYYYFIQTFINVSWSSLNVLRMTLNLHYISCLFSFDNAFFFSFYFSLNSIYIFFLYFRAYCNLEPWWMFKFKYKAEHVGELILYFFNFLLTKSRLLASKSWDKPIHLYSRYTDSPVLSIESKILLSVYLCMWMKMRINR